MTPVILPVVDTWARDWAGKQCISMKEMQSPNNRNRRAAEIYEWVMHTSWSREMLCLYAFVLHPSGLHRSVRLMKGILLVQPIVSIGTMQKGKQSGFPSTVREDL
jgi:hypothetical protein